MTYTGINLPDYVTIVENKSGQGWVVPKGNDLTAAKNWARSGDWEPKEYTYKNGTFTLRVTDAAGGSSQGGKLSFWNCQIRTEDDKEFLIGISSDCLAELIINNTLVNGKCQNKIYLAKYKGNSTWALTENMPSYKMAREEIEAKNSIEITSKYNPGDVIKTTQTTRLYLGELYEYAATYTSKYRNRGGVALDLWSARDRYDRLIVIWNKPKKFHWFKRYYGD